jgi:hypothetical protein
MTRQVVDGEGGTIRRRVCSGPLCGHRFYSLTDAERAIPDWAIEWFHGVPTIARDALAKLEDQP